MISLLKKYQLWKAKKKFFDDIWQRKRGYDYADLYFFDKPKIEAVHFLENQQAMVIDHTPFDDGIVDRLTEAYGEPKCP